MPAAPSPYAIYDTAPPPSAPVLDVDPFTIAFFAEPFPVHERLRDAGPFVWLSRYNIGAVARYEVEDRLARRGSSKICTSSAYGSALCPATIIIWEAFRSSRTMRRPIR